jgi:hypothetical protein
VTSLWFIAQGVYACAAWSFAARAVVRSADLAGVLASPLVSRARSWRGPEARARRRRIAQQLNSPAVSLLMQEPLEEGEHFVDRLDDALGLAAPPSRAMRGMATIGTMFGLLAAIALLRGRAGDARVAAAAFECALLGFVTAVPLWTAVGVCGARARRSALGLERLASALDGDGPAEGEDRGETTALQDE